MEPGRTIIRTTTATHGTGRGRRALLEVTPRGRRLLAAGQEAVAAVDAELRGLGPLPPDQELFRLTSAVARRAEA